MADDTPDPPVPAAGDSAPPPAGDSALPPAGESAVGARASEPSFSVADEAGRPAGTARKVVYLVPNGPDTHPPGASSSAVVATPVRTSVVGPGDSSTDDHDDEEEDADGAAGDRRDWEWVEEWRAGREPTPWATGLALTGFTALVVGVAIWVLCAGLADRPVIAVLVNALVAAGLAPAMWLCRGLPVLRWIAAGALVGVIGGWVAAVLMLPLPVP